MRSLILFLLTIFSFSALAQADLEERIGFFAEQSELFTQICFTPDGTFKAGVTHYDPAGSIRKTAIDCDAQLSALTEEHAEIEALVTNISPTCDATSADEAVADLLTGTGAALDQSRSCPGSGGANSCIGDIACNLGSSLVPLNLLQCGASDTNCFTNIFGGIGYSFYDMGCGIISLFSDACTQEEPADEEGASSDAAVVASFQSNQDVVTFRQDPLRWVGQKVSGIIDQIGDSILERFGCADWEGTPFLSTCKAPVSWSCANCGQRTNMVCGVVGYIAGFAAMELATGFLVGAAGGIIASAASRIARTASTRFPASIARLGTLSSRVGGFAARHSLRAQGRLSTLWRGVAGTIPVRAVLDISAQVARGTQALGRGIVVANNTLRSSIVLFGIGQDAIIAAAVRYNELAEAAFYAGYKATGRARSATIVRVESSSDSLSDLTEGRLVGADGEPFASIEEYERFKRSGLKPEEQSNYQLHVTRDGADSRLVFSRKADVEYNSGISADLTPDVPAPPPVAAVVDDASSGPDIIVTASADYKLSRADVTRLQERLRGRVDLDNIELPIPANIAADLTKDERALVIQEVLGRRLQSGSADDILKELRLGSSAMDLRNFQGRRQRIINALEEMGYEAQEAAEKADILFASNLLGDIPPRTIPPLAPAVPGQPPRLDLSRAGADRTFDFQAREALENELSIIVQRTPALRGRTTEDILSEIQRGTRTFDLDPNQAGIDNFFRRYGVTQYAQRDIRTRLDDIIRQRRDITIRNVDTDMRRLGTRVESRSVSCNQVNNLYNDAFLPDAGCKEIRFTQPVKGEYCTCNLTDTNRVMSRAPGPWLLPCAQIGAQYNISRGQSDVSALPVKDRALNRCWKVDIEPGVTCYHGGLGPTFTGFGGEAQMNCSNRRITRASGDTTEPWGDGPANGWTVARYSPISDDPRMLRITDAGRRCLDGGATRGVSTCQPQDLASIREEVAALRREGPNEALTAEDINEAEIYVQYLEGKVEMDQFGNLRCLGSSEIANTSCP